MPRTFQRLVNAMVQIGGWALLSAACLVTYDVITRKLFNISIAGADEISGYVFAIATAIAFTYALYSRTNIRIDLLYNLLPQQVRGLFDLIAMALTMGYFAVLTWFAYGLVADAFRYNSHSITPLQIPLALPQTPWFAALLLATLTATVVTVRLAFLVVKGRWNEITQLAGIPLISEEIAEELGDRAPDEKV